MAITGDGASTYQSGGAGGKFRKKPNRRSALATPYDRPSIALRNNNPSLLAKLVDPASRLIYAGADRLFGVFRKRLPALPAQRQPGTSEQPRNGSQEAVSNSALKNFTLVVEANTNEGGNSASISAATEISDLENMLKQKTFTRSEIERLTALLLSKTADSNHVEGDKEQIPNTSYHVPKPDAFTNGTLNKHVEDRKITNFDAAISTPAVNTRAFEDDGASPADLAKAYMGTRPTKLSPLTIRPIIQPPRQDSMLFNNTTIIPKTPTASLALKSASAMKTSENSLTTFRSRGRSALYNMPRTPYYRGPLTLSQKGVTSPSAWEHEGSVGSSRMAAKRRSSALDDIGSGGPMRRIRQKASLLSQQNSFGSSQKLLLRNEPDPKGKKVVEETVEISKRNQSFGSVPTESSKMALKIFEQLDRMSPKEKHSGSKLALTTQKIDPPKFLSSSLDNQKSEGQNRVLFPDTRESTFENKDTGKENGSSNIAGQSNALSSVNGSGDALSVTKFGSTNKQAFSMSANEDSLEVDDGKHSNGHVSFSLAESKKPEKSLLANNNVSTVAHAESIQTPAPPKVGQTKLPEVDHNSGKPEFKKRAISPEGSVFNNQKTSFNFSPSTSIINNTQSSVSSQPTSIVDTVTPQNKPTVFPTFRTSNSGEKPTSLINLTKNNDQVQLSDSKKDDNTNTQRPVNLFGNSTSSSSSVNLTTASTSGIFSFGGSTNNSVINNGISASTPSVFAFSSSFQSSATTTTATVTATTSAASGAFPTTVSAPVFSFGSATASSTSASLAPTSSFASSSFATSSNGGSIYGLTSSSTPLTTNGIQANTAVTQAASTAVTQAAPFKFNSTTLTSPSSTSASSLFNSSAPSFGLASAATSSDIKSGGSTSGPTTNIFGSGFSSTPSFGLNSTIPSSDTKSGSSTTNVFGSTPFSFVASSTSTPSAASSPFMFGSSNAGASTGPSFFSFSSNSPTNYNNNNNNSNDHMSMEDSMVDDANQTPSPSISAFAQPSSGTPGFMFGSAATPPPVTPPPMVPFQFVRQTNQPQTQPQPLSQNTFQPPGGSPFNAGGSFSLGSGGGDEKSNRRIVKVKRQNRKK